MTDRERKSMIHASLLLLGAAAVRFVVTAPPTAVAPLEGRPSIADSLLVAGDSAMAEKERRSRPLIDGETIDPNTASEEELDRLPGIGASKARRLVEDRLTRGPFANAAALARVPGLGPGSVERLAPFLRFDSRTALPEPARASLRPTAPRTAPTPRPPRTFRPTAASVPGGLADPNPSMDFPDGPLDLNGATADELEALPGIGPALAQRIVDYRSQHGSFAAPEDLKKVSGIGDKTFARLAPSIRTRRR